LSNAPKTKINKESLRAEIAADLGIKIDANDPLLLAAHVAAIVTRDTIAQERAFSADNQLLSFGDVRNVLLDVRDETIKVTDQIVGVVWMKIQQGLEERVNHIVGDTAGGAATVGKAITFGAGVAFGICLTVFGSKIWH